MYNKPGENEINAPIVSDINQSNQAYVPPQQGTQMNSQNQIPMQGQPQIQGQPQTHDQPQNIYQNPNGQGQYYQPQAHNQPQNIYQNPNGQGQYYQPQGGQPLYPGQVPNIQYTHGPVIVQPIVEIPMYSQERKIKLKQMYSNHGFLLIFLNIFFPGWGTIIVGPVLKPRESCYYITIGLLQFFLCWTIIGYICAQISSCSLYSYWSNTYFDPLIN